MPAKGQFKDITGQRFGKLVVLGPTEERRNRQVVWKCQCDCGNACYVVGGSLRSGHTKTCGCSWVESKNIIDETGKRYGHLTVIKRSEYKSSNRSVYWDCICDCGNRRTVIGTSLRNGSITSCQECAQKRGAQKRLALDLKNTGPMKDHSGERFGKLIALEPIAQRDNAGRVVWKCQCDCGNICYVSSNSLVSGNTMSCGCLNTNSHGEIEIEQLLKENNINYQKQFSFSDLPLLRFDFAIIQNNQPIRLIEFDGEQHFIAIDFFGGEDSLLATKERDSKKNIYALTHNIPLVRIPYTQRNKISITDILGDNYLVKIL